MRVFIDFDYTLCNTQKVKSDIHSLPRVYGWDERRFMSSERIVVERGHYSLRGHLLEYGCSLDECVEVEADFFSDGSRWLYPDALTFLERNAKHELFVLSYGDSEFQKAKIEATGISSLVSEIVCVTESKVSGIKDIVSKDEVFMFIDDRAIHIDAIAAQYPLSRCVRILRPESPYLGEIADATILLVTDLSFIVSEVQ